MSAAHNRVQQQRAAEAREVHREKMARKRGQRDTEPRRAPPAVLYQRRTPVTAADHQALTLAELKRDFRLAKRRFVVARLRFGVAA